MYYQTTQQTKPELISTGRMSPSCEWIFRVDFCVVPSARGIDKDYYSYPLEDFICAYVIQVY